MFPLVLYTLLKKVVVGISIGKSVLSYTHNVLSDSIYQYIP